METHDSIADVLLRGLEAEERDRVVTRLQQAARDERSAAEAGHPKPFPGPAPARPTRGTTPRPGERVLLTDAELERAANAPWRGPS